MKKRFVDLNSRNCGDHYNNSLHTGFVIQNAYFPGLTDTLIFHAKVIERL